MTDTIIIPERLAEFESLTLKRGGHAPSSREFCFNEAASWLAGERHSDAPSCVSPVLRRYTMRLNDRWDDEKRQTLKAFLPRVIGTAGDGLDARREQIAAEWVTKRLLGPWLRLAGLDAEANAIEAVDSSDTNEMRRLINAASDAAWKIRSGRYAELRKVVRAKVMEQNAKKPDAVAVAAAVADAVAAAVAVAVAVAAAVAAAVAVAVADADAVAVAVAAAVAAAVADADAAAVAAAAAAAAADADADAVADADAPVDTWGTSYSAAYKAARAYYDAHPLPISQQVADLAAEKQGAALELLEALIDPQVAS